MLVFMLSTNKEFRELNSQVFELKHENCYGCGNVFNLTLCQRLIKDVIKTCSEINIK